MTFTFPGQIIKSSLAPDKSHGRLGILLHMHTASVYTLNCLYTQAWWKSCVCVFKIFILSQSKTIKFHLYYMLASFVRVLNNSHHKVSHTEGATDLRTLERIPSNYILEVILFE